MNLTGLLFSIVFTISGSQHPQQSGSPLVFDNPTSTTWHYDVEIFSPAGDLLSSGWGKIECVGSAPIPTSAQVDHGVDWAYPVHDSIVVSGPWRFQWSTFDTEVFEDNLLVETSLGIIEIRRTASISLPELILPRAYSIGHQWLTSPDAGYRITKVDSVEFDGQFYPTVHLRWTHALSPGETQITIWAIGLGILEHERARGNSKLSRQYIHFKLREVSR